MPLELSSVPLPAAAIEPFRELLEPEEWDTFVATMRDLSAALTGRRIWNINSTAHGGGVAEMLGWEIPYERAAGMDVRWVVIQGRPSFFTFTKRLHALLHGVAADGVRVADVEREEYERTLARNAQALRRQIRAGDVAILHDPQTAGLIPELVRLGSCVIWRCHVGIDEPNDVARAAWHFLLPYVGAAHACVFSRRAYVWEGLDPRKVWVTPPAIDAFTAKNEDMDPDTVTAILARSGILADGGWGGDASFPLRDGTSLRVEHAAQLVPDAKLPANARLVVQVSRWDRLKDPLGVMQGFAEFVAPHADGHLILAGPGVSSVADDPEEASVFREVDDFRKGLTAEVRDRTHLARLPMENPEENAAIVNALQRRADIIVQKSLREGFGLTVAEAMWKRRPVIASRVGGIQDQIEDGRSGVLIDPRDLQSFGAAVVALLNDPKNAARLGGAARDRVRREFLAPHLLTQQAHLIEGLLGKN